MDAKAVLIDQKAVVPAVGVSFCVLRDETGADLAVGTPITLAPQPSNPYDTDAIAITSGENLLGYVPKAFAKRISSDTETAGRVLHAHIVEVRAMPTFAVAEFVLADGTRIEKGTPLSELSVPVEDVEVFAVTDKGTLPVSGFKVQQRFDGPVVTWSNPIVGFSFRADEVGDFGAITYAA